MFSQNGVNQPAAEEVHSLPEQFRDFKYGICSLYFIEVGRLVPKLNPNPFVSKRPRARTRAGGGRERSKR